MRLWPRRAPKPAPGAMRPGDLADFLRAGGTPTLTEWALVPPDMRAALVQAGDVVAAERALVLAAALSGPDGARDVSRVADGGATVDDEAMRVALDGAMRSLNRRRL